MPIFRILPYELDVSREVALLDTNVLFAAFSRNDQRKQNASEFLFNVWEDMLLLPLPVLIETWGMLVGSEKNWEGGLQLLSWVNNPGNAVTLLPQHVKHSMLIRDIAAKLHIDCVDAALICLADEFTEQCELAPPIKIVTYDTADFVKCMQYYQLRITILDPNTLDTYP